MFLLTVCGTPSSELEFERDHTNGTTVQCGGKKGTWWYSMEEGFMSSASPDYESHGTCTHIAEYRVMRSGYFVFHQPDTIQFFVDDDLENALVSWAMLNARTILNDMKRTHG